jgi:tetratricopeptide (TPR) repeat protein
MEQGKAKRNLDLLTREVQENPENYNMWSYLGDSLLSFGQIKEAEVACLHVINRPDGSISHSRETINFCNLLKIKCQLESGSGEEILSYYRKAKNLGCASPDLEYWVGSRFYQLGEEETCVFYLEEALKLLEQGETQMILILPGELSRAYQLLFWSYDKMQRLTDMVRYGVLTLRVDPSCEGVLIKLLSLFKKEPGEEDTAEKTYGFLSGLYDFSSMRDKLLLIKASKLTAFDALERRVYDSLSEEELAFMSE